MNLLKHVLCYVLLDLFPNSEIIHSFNDSKLCYITVALSMKIETGLEVILEQKLREFLSSKPSIEQVEMSTKALQYYFQKSPEKLAVLRASQKNLLKVAKINTYVNLEEKELEDIQTISYAKMVQIEHLQQESHKRKKYVVSIVATASENKKSLSEFVKIYRAYRGHLFEPYFQFFERDWVFLPKAYVFFRFIEESIQKIYLEQGYLRIKTQLEPDTTQYFFEKHRFFCLYIEKSTIDKKVLGYLASKNPSYDYCYLAFHKKNAPIFLKMILGLYTLIPLDIYFILSSKVDFALEGIENCLVKQSNDFFIQVMTTDTIGRQWEMAKWDCKGLNLCSNVERLVALMIELEERKYTQ